MLRDIVVIDESKCDGCGLCVPACAEGAIRIIDGKARLVSDTLCDGLGACLGHCPKDAIRIERREAAAFDEAAVAAHASQPVSEPARSAAAPSPPAAHAPAPHGGCPGATFTKLGGQPVPGGCPSSRFASLAPASQAGPDPAQPSPAVSELAHWPVQLRLLSPSAPVLQGARLLIAADCVPVALPDFHARLLRGRAIAIACPKLDDPAGYVEKLAAMMTQNDLQEITVAHMQVPCCTGLLHMVLEARRRSGCTVPIVDMVVGLRGETLSERTVPVESAC